MYVKIHCTMDCYDIMMFLPFTIQVKEAQTKRQNGLFIMFNWHYQVKWGKYVS
jgi:hypothetical protein